jgi:hypothetical protein
MVTTYGDRCRHAGTADGGTPEAMQMMSAGAMGTGLVIVNGGDGFQDKLGQGILATSGD